MKRVTLILSLAVAAGMLLSKEEANAMTPSQAMAVQAAEQAVAFPGLHPHWQHQGPLPIDRLDHLYLRRLLTPPMGPPPLILRPYPPYSGFPGGLRVC